VSRGAVKRLLLSDSSECELYETSNALRTQFFSLSGISVEKNKSWIRGEHPAFCVQWDGIPPPQPLAENPVFGKIYLTHHTLVEYLNETKGGCKPENVFPRIAASTHRSPAIALSFFVSKKVLSPLEFSLSWTQT